MMQSVMAAWQEIATAFVSMVALDFAWARYNLACAEKQALVGGVYAAVILALGAFVVLTYVENSWMLIPATCGAFVGTFGSIWLSNLKPPQPKTQPDGGI